jgi:hypothetical protein
VCPAVPSLPPIVVDDDGRNAAPDPKIPNCTRNHDSDH